MNAAAPDRSRRTVAEQSQVFEIEIKRKKNSGKKKWKQKSERNLREYIYV
jgi:hypothetical protein